MFMMIKESIHQKDIRIINIYAPNNRVPKYTKKKFRTEDANRQFDESSWRFQYPAFYDGWNKQVKQGSREPENAVNQLDPAEIYGACHTAGAESMICSSACGTFPGETIC